MGYIMYSCYKEFIWKGLTYMKKKTYMLLACIVVFLIVEIGGIAGIYLERTNAKKETPIYTAVDEYEKGNVEWKHPDVTYEKYSAEEIFLKGMDAYVAEDYAKAKGYFEQALEEDYEDKALPAYLYIYINQCQYLIDGYGDIDTVSLALEAIRQYQPHCDDTHMLWDMFYSVTLVDDNYAAGIELIEEHIEKADLDINTWAWLKNYIAVVQCTYEEYSKAIRNFYDVEQVLENEKINDRGREELEYAKEYIANIYFLFKDYEKAADMYGELIEMASNRDTFYGYACAINMANAYLEIGELEKATEALDTLESYLTKVEPNLLDEINATMYDMHANIAMERGQLDLANDYLNKAEAYYKYNSGGAAFLGMDYISKISRAEYWYRIGEYDKAQEILQRILDSGENNSYGAEEDLYDLLVKIYEATGAMEKANEVYKKRLDMNNRFSATVQREYLEFSEYYQENNQLKAANDDLYKSNRMAGLVILIISAILMMAIMIAYVLKNIGETDQLTDVWNRKKLTRMLKSYEKSGTPGNMSIIMMDIDYFKKYNDHYGHPAGDEVLKAVAKVVKDSVRKKDLVIRYGGEEFLVFLEEANANIAREVCERIHKQLAEKAIPHEKSEVSKHITVSIGVCYQRKKGSCSLDQIIDIADEALYEAKRTGRNRSSLKEI